MTAIYTICLILILGYVTLMYIYRGGWFAQSTFEIPNNFSANTFISIIIPARNEELNIGNCLDSIILQNYPANLFEIIVVDDHSEDKTAEIIKSFKCNNIKYINLKEQLCGNMPLSYKKAAIALGIKHCKGELIITTDADCLVPKNWLINYAAAFQQSNPDMIIGPVCYYINNQYKNSILQTLQTIDFMGMQGITVAALSMKMGNMCNGANLAFTQSAYNLVDGYKGVDHFATGDDYLLMMKISKLKNNNILYLKSQESIVLTAPQKDWSDFLQQRIRWASKSGKYPDKKLNSILIFVYVFNFSFLLLPILSIALLNIELFYITILNLFIKIIAEFLFLIPVSRFFKYKNHLLYIILLQPLHITYIIIAGFLGFFSTYSWKGRTINTNTKDAVSYN